MRNIGNILFLLGCFVLTSCSDSGSFFQEERMYRLPYSIEDACEDGERIDDEVFINCSATLSLRTDGRAAIAFSDILNPARYEVRGEILRVEVENAIESGDSYTFKIRMDETEILDIDSENTWYLEEK